MSDERADGNILINPVDGEIVSNTDSDAIWEAIAAARKMQEKLGAFCANATAAICAMAEQPGEDRRTVRLRGDKYRLVIEYPADSWDNTILKKLWSERPDLARQYLRIERVAVQAKEVKKLKHESGDDNFASFRQALLAACRGRVGLPRVTMESPILNSPPTSLEEVF